MKDVKPEWCDAIIAWANGEPEVRRVWLYGSRVSGQARPDSDLDVALEIQQVNTRFDDDFVLWMVRVGALVQCVTRQNSRSENPS